MPDTAPPSEGYDLEEQILRVGESLWRRTRGELPGLFNPRTWHALLLDRAMADPAFKTDLFRFVDVLPTLRDARQVSEHIKAYFLRNGRELPVPIALAMKAAAGRWTAGLGAWAIRRNVTEMARRFIAGENVGEALRALKALRQEGIGFTADLLGEATLGEREAEAFRARYLELIDKLADETASWTEDPLLDRNHLGPIPRANVSLKLSALDPALEPADPAGGVGRLLARALPIFLRAKARGVFINVDMEQWSLHEIVMDLFEAVATHDELRTWPHLGIVVQAYLKTARRDVERLAALARRRGAPLTVRLVKGAYWDAEVVRARQFGYPCPVLLEKAQTDANYEALTAALLENPDCLLPAFASHNLRSLAHAMVRAIRLRAPENAYEIQMLYGMAEPERRALRAMGRRVRAYTPIGDLLPGMAYLVRRLLENTANSGFLRLSYHDRRDVKELLLKPGSADAPARSPLATANPQSEARAGTPALPGNCPLTDFTEPSKRAEFAEAVARVGRDLPLRVPVIVGGRERSDREIMKRLCPSDTTRETAAVALAAAADADEAARIAMAAWPAWRDRPLEDRARLLERLAERLERDRTPLAALECWEVAKPWREADADVAEAIDFCRYYAAAAREELAPEAGRGFDPTRRLAEPTYSAFRIPHSAVPGETNTLVYEGCGPAVIIAPWNFPLAILCGMSAAALVAGCPVLLKPAEQSSAVACAYYRHLVAAGFPPEVVQFLPGAGEVVGRRLVEHPLVAMVAFTGSRIVGLQIIEQAAKTPPGQPQVKRVVCEMGGKNAIVIDEDADLDEAVAGVIKSAFDYAGQKCSACSRAIVVGDVAQAFMARLAEAAAALPILPATDPACRIGPVVDEEAHRRLIEAIEHPGPGATLFWRGPSVAQASSLQGEGRQDACATTGGWFVPPAIFEVRERGHRFMKEELFGPLLAVWRAATFAEALEVAGDTEYALTGGVYSRNPYHLDLARAKFRVGNLYLNRAITGAAVGRQPFGGLALSGVGAKAGGTGYLAQFAQTRCVTDNTTRHGFTPDVW